MRYILTLVRSWPRVRALGTRPSRAASAPSLIASRRTRAMNPDHHHDEEDGAEGGGDLGGDGKSGLSHAALLSAHSRRILAYQPEANIGHRCPAGPGKAGTCGKSL